MPSVAIFGATGFIGVPFSRALKEAHPDWTITAYVRSTKPTEELKATLKADNIVVGNFDEADKIKAVAKEHDISVNAGNSFTADPVVSIIAGLKEKSTKGKLIHISGAGNFIDFGTSGNFNPESKVWNDNNVEDIKAIHKDMFNGQSDTLAIAAGADGSVDSYIACPSVVFGGSSYNAPTIGIGYTLITGNAKPLGYVPYVGEGTAVLSTVHVLDVVDFLIKLMDIAAKPAEGSVYEHFYMLETSRVAWKDVATELAKVMHSKGVFPTPEPKAVEFEQAGEGEVKHLVAANMLMKGDRAAAVGFKPSHGTILDLMADDLKVGQF